MTRFRSLLDRIRDTRSGATTDPLDIDAEPCMCGHGLGQHMDAGAGACWRCECGRYREPPTEKLEESQPADPWLDAITPPVDEDTDPGGADLASPDPEPCTRHVFLPKSPEVCVGCGEVFPHRAGGHRSTQTLYGDGVSRCGVLGCGTNTTGLVCSVCLAAGRLPPDVDGYMPPYLERILPDPPNSRHTPGFLDGAGYVLEPLPDVADFDEARDRLRTEVIDRIDAGGAA